MDAVRFVQRTYELVTFNANIAEGSFIDHKNGGGSDKDFHSLAIPAPSTCPYATVNTEKSSIECTVNDDNARMSREILLHLQTSFFLNAYILIPITI